MRLLLCDLGNTRIKFGVAEASVIKNVFSLPTRREATADSLGLEIKALLAHAGISQIEACVATSVVPVLNLVLRGACQLYLNAPVLFAPEDLPIPLENRYERPQEVGADRLVGAYSARMLRPESPGLLVIDFGTAVTFDCIAGSAYLGGLIFPGPAAAAASLAAATARLPLVSLEAAPQGPEPRRDTATSIQHGLLYGYASLTEGMSAKLLEQLPKPACVIGTGGFAALISKIAPVFATVRPNLVLEGLLALYNINKQ